MDGYIDLHNEDSPVGYRAQVDPQIHPEFHLQVERRTPAGGRQDAQPYEKRRRTTGCLSELNIDLYQIT